MDTDLLPVLVHIQTGLDTDLTAATLAGRPRACPNRRCTAASSRLPARRPAATSSGSAWSVPPLSCCFVTRRSCEIALDNGFASHEVFARAFRRHFGASPSEWRERQTAGGLGEHGRAPGLSEVAEGASISSTRLVEMRPIEIAFLRNVGPYDEIDGDDVGRASAIGSRELGRSTDGLPLGIGHDDPWITPPERLRYDAGWTIDEDLPPESGLGQQTVPGGSYVSTTYVGPFHLIGEAYRIVGGAHRSTHRRARGRQRRIGRVVSHRLHRRHVTS